MVKKYKYEIYLLVYMILTYTIIGYFTNSNFPVKAILTGVIALIFYTSLDSMKDSLYLLVPVAFISAIITIVLPNLIKEWAVCIGMVAYLSMVYIYSATKSNFKAKRK